MEISIFRLRVAWPKLVQVIFFTAFIGLLCVPLVYSNEMIDGIINAKTVYFFLIIGLIALISAFQVIVSDLVYRLNRLDIAVILFLVFSTIHNATVDFQFLLQRNLENVGLMISYLFVKKVIKVKASIPLLTIAIFSIAGIQVFTAVMQDFGIFPSFNTNFRFTGFFFNPAPYAIFLSTLLVLILTSEPVNKIPTRILVSVLFVIGILLVVISQSRSSWLSLLIVLPVLMDMRYKFITKFWLILKRYRLCYTVTSVVIVSIAFGGYYLYELKTDSANGRVLIWKIALRMLYDHPFSGVGASRFQVLFLKYQYCYFHKFFHQMSTEGRNTDQVAYAFNDYLQLVVEQGIFGLILFATALVNYFKMFLKAVKLYSNGLLKLQCLSPFLAVLVLLISALFSYPLSILPLKLHFFILLGAVSIGDNLPFPRSINGKILASKAARWFVAGVLLSTGIVFLFFGVVYLKGYNQEGLVSKDILFKPEMDRLQDYEYFLGQDPWFIVFRTNTFIRNSDFTSAIAALRYSENYLADRETYYTLGRIYEMQKKYQDAEHQYLFLHYAFPDLIRPKYLLAKLYLKTRQRANWRRFANDVLTSQPKIHSENAVRMKNEIQFLFIRNQF